MKTWCKLMILTSGWLVLSSFSQANDNELAKMKALEAQLEKEVAQETLSPKQVVIVNNGSSNKQEQKSEQKQKTEQQQSSSQKAVAWGTGDNINELRKDRRSVEQINEQALMEKLEQSRIEDEKSRLDRLFKVQEYNRRRKQELGETDLQKADIVPKENAVKVKDEITEIIEEVPLNANQANTVQKQPEPKVILPQPPVNYVVAPPAQALTPHPAISSESTLVTPPLKEKSVYDDMFIRGILAAGAYTEVNNVNAQTSWGLAIGKNLSKRTFIEGQMVKAKFRVDDPEFTRFRRLLDQYNFSGIFGYKVGDVGSKFAPHLRAGLSYVRRDSQSARDRGRDKVSSNSFDGIVGAGADYKLTKNISITGTAEYYFNMFDDVSGNDLSLRRADSKIEEENYFIIGVGFKLNF